MIIYIFFSSQSSSLKASVDVPVYRWLYGMTWCGMCLCKICLFVCNSVECSPSLDGLLFCPCALSLSITYSHSFSRLCVCVNAYICLCMSRLVHCSVIRCIDACGTRVFVLLKRELSTTCTPKCVLHNYTMCTTEWIWIKQQQQMRNKHTKKIYRMSVCVLCFCRPGSLFADCSCINRIELMCFCCHDRSHFSLLSFLSFLFLTLARFVWKLTSHV